MKRTGALLLLAGLHLGFAVDAAAQQWLLPHPDAGESFGPHRLFLDFGVLGGSIGYAHQVSPTTSVGVALGGGFQLGFMLPTGELAGDTGAPGFLELVSGAAFARGEIGSRTEIEGGARVAWLYHPPTEHETIFTGVFGALYYRIGVIRLGPRVYLGRLSEEAGRTQLGFGVVPLAARVTWSW